MKNQPAKNLQPPFLRALPLSVRNLYIPLKTAVIAKGSADLNKKRLKLAFVSPLPPEQTGIAEYSVRLLPALAKYYDIEIIRTPELLFKNLHQIDRVLYHFGNSPFHSHMVELIEKIPGVVVLHDFFLGGLYAYLDCISGKNYGWTRELYHSHGYPAVLERYIANDPYDLQINYPVNLSILQQAKGIIVHSQHAKQLANQWYGENFSENWQVIPMLSVVCKENSREKARQALGFKITDFLICSFGFLGATKLNHRLLNAWLSSNLLQNHKTILIFVGQAHANLYNKELQDIITENHLEGRVYITGWLDKEMYSHYLAAADLAVQLRAQSRGETSGAVHECMSYALPTIVNANGSFAELQTDTVWLLHDDFSDIELMQALETLYLDENRRLTLGNRAQEVINMFHSPEYCADLYTKAIESFYVAEAFNPIAVIKSFIEKHGKIPTDQDLVACAQSLRPALLPPTPFRQLLLDVSATCRNNLKTGIERVVEGLILEFLKAKIPNYRVEPVYLSMENGKWCYRYANEFTLKLSNCPQSLLLNDLVEVQKGDILLTLDFSSTTLAEAVSSKLHLRWQEQGVKIYSLIHDLLPISLPQAFPNGTDIYFRYWLEAISQFDGAICTSQTGATVLRNWREKNNFQSKSYSIAWTHLGANNFPPKSDAAISPRFAGILEQFLRCPTFLMVGTIEPRKNYLQAIQAFSLLWQQGLDVNLVIVGKEGWKGVPNSQRRDIIETIQCLHNHPQLSKHLFWFNGINDTELEKIYIDSSCLIAASLDEGFGLPLIEAAYHCLPIIARDLPIFREIAGEHAYYFSGDAIALADTIQSWLALHRLEKHPNSQGIRYLTWEQSATNMLNILFG